ncbi:MAG: UDP-2,3-diacylglucosamine diphosphatase LpxI [Dongiaceae bacterium]
MAAEAGARLGIIAGGGALPLRLAAACRASGRPFLVAALKGQAAPEAMAGLPHAWVRLGAAGGLCHLLREAGVGAVVLAGTVRRPSVLALFPDLLALRLLLRAGGLAVGDNRLMMHIVLALERELGVPVLAPSDLLPDCLAPTGPLGRLAPLAADAPDIALGLAAAAAHGARDVGQACVVQQGRVLALEDRRGTDALIERSRALRRPGRGPILVKTKKPQQDLRADPPAVGPETVRRAAAAGFAGLALGAGSVVLIDREALVAAADEAGLFVAGVAGAR